MEIVLDDFEIDACIKIKKYFVVMLNVSITINISMYINLGEFYLFAKCHVLSVVSLELFVRSWFFCFLRSSFSGVDLPACPTLHQLDCTEQSYCSRYWCRREGG